VKALTGEKEAVRPGYIRRGDERQVGKRVVRSAKRMSGATYAGREWIDGPGVFRIRQDENGAACPCCRRYGVGVRQGETRRGGEVRGGCALRQIAGVYTGCAALREGECRGHNEERRCNW